MQSLSRGLARALLPVLGISFAAVACGSDAEDDGGLIVGNNDDDGLQSGTGSSGTGSGSGSGVDQDLDGREPNGQCRALSLAEGCSGSVFEGEAAALDLLLVFDESGSMSTKVDEGTGATRIDIVRGALDSFLRAEESTGIGIGLSYFGHMPLKETSCDPKDYRNLAVPFGVLPDHAEEVISALEAQQPTGETPTGAAIRAACDLAAEHRKEARNAFTSILLVTDGEPKAPATPDCSPTLKDAIQAAQTCYEETGLLTYVLGVGPSLTNLNKIAEAGGTGSAYLADLDNQEQVLDAFRRIRISAQIPCDFEIVRSTTSEPLNYDDSTVAYVDTACTYSGFARVEDVDACAKGGLGYFFDNPDDPKRIELCPEACSEVRSRGQQLFYSLGCPLDVDIIK